MLKHSATALLRFCLCLALVWSVGSCTAAPTTASEAPAPAITGALKVETHPGNVFATGEPIRIRVEITGEQPAAGRLRLQLFDAEGTRIGVPDVTAGAGSTALELAVPPLAATVAGQAAAEVTLPPTAARPYLELRLIDSTRPDAVLARQSVLVLAPVIPADKRFGFNGRPELAGLARRLGAVWLRNHIPWDQGAEDKPLGAAGIEKTIAVTQAGGCEVFGISNYGLPWATVYAKDDDRPMRDYFSPPRPAAWDAYVRFAAQKIRGKVPVFEVWNEANFDMFWRSTPDTFEQRVADYSALLIRTYAIMKAEAPELQITNGSIVNVRKDEPLRFLAALLDKGCGASFDILNVHYYRSAMDPEEEAGTRSPRCAKREFKPEGALASWLVRAQEVMAKQQLTKPVWMTEMGWPTVDPGGWGGIVSELDQARLLVRSHVLCFAQGVAVVQWFDLSSDGFGVFRAELSPKPAAAAYAQLVTALDGRAFAQRLPGDGARVYLFTGQGPALAVAWAFAPVTWAVPAEFEIASARDVWGQELPALRGVRSLSLTGSPVYLQLKTR